MGLRITAAIETFELLSQIAEDNRITDTLWAAASRIAQPRIAELRQIQRRIRAQGIEQGQAQADVRRTCSVDKVYKLYNGLAYLLGEDIMDHEVSKLIEREKDKRKKLFLLLSLVKERDYAKAEKSLKDLLKVKTKNR